MAETADVLVIGAGVAGLGAAGMLAADASAIVLEAEPVPCFHTSGRSAAVYIKSYGPPGVRAATLASEAFFHAPPEGFAEAPLISPRGLLFLDPEGGALAGLAAETPGLRFIGREEAAERCPAIRFERVVDIAWEEDAQDLDVDLIAGGFRRMMRAGRGRLVTGARVGALTRAGGVWRAETAAGAFEAPVLVNAAGAWASGVAAMAGAAPIRIQPKRRSAAVVPPPAGMDARAWPLFTDAKETWYAKPAAGKLIVSPADAEPMEPCDAWPDDMVLAEGLQRFEEAVTFPVTRVERSWAGLRSFAPDGEPAVGFDPAAEGFFWLAGQGGYGFQTAPALSRLAADLVLRRAPALDPRPFDPARFG